MATSHPVVANVIDLRLGLVAGESETITLVESEHLKVIGRLVAKGRTTDVHIAPGDTTVQCIVGQVEVLMGEQGRRIGSGQMVYLPPGCQHALRGWEDSIVLLTVARDAAAEHFSHDLVEEASEESFPASDPPSFNPITRP